MPADTVARSLMGNPECARSATITVELYMCAEGPLGMLSIGSNGALTTVLGSPFSVSGIAQALDLNCASNLVFAPTGTTGQGGVNVLNIASNGALTPIAGSPFTFSGSTSLVDVLSPDDQHLFVSNLFSNTITSLTVAAGGTPTEVSGSPFPTSPISSPRSRWRRIRQEPCFMWRWARLEAD